MFSEKSKLVIRSHKEKLVLFLGQRGGHKRPFQIQYRLNLSLKEKNHKKKEDFESGILPGFAEIKMYSH